MKILLTGILSPMIWGMVDRLVREGHQVALLGHGLTPAPAQTKAVVHDISPDHPDAPQVLKASRFGAIVFFYAYQCEDTIAYGSIQGAMLDALFLLQHTASGCGVEQFMLVTDLRVFGGDQAGREEETPSPETATGILINTAEEVLRCIGPGSMRTLLIRVTNLYSPGMEDDFFTRAKQCAETNQVMLMNGSPENICDFLHVDDLSLFITLALDKKISGTAHLAYGERFTYGDTAAQLQQFLPGLRVAFSDNPVTRPRLQCALTFQKTGWIPRHRWVTELAEIYQKQERSKKNDKPRDWLSVMLHRVSGSALPLVELVLLGVIAESLLRMSQTNATFRFLDYWLFYVILMGTLHGGSIGILAGLVACIGYCLNWFLDGKDLYLLLYNKDNWLPLMMYILGGGIFGYQHDKSAENLESIKQEIEQRTAEIEFVQTMYKQVDADRNSLQEQVMRFRDSYGRIYSITQELDTLQPEQVYLSTLDVLEDVMQNHSVALYSCSTSSSFARLVVHSRLMEELPKSIDMKAYPLMWDRFNKGEMFANSQLEPGYPAFCAPIMQDETPIAIVALWDVPFKQQTLYRQNLFSVVTGFVQSAMVRAMHYYDSAHDMYISNTHILSDKAFRSTLSVYNQMRKQRVSTFLLLSVGSLDNITSIEEYDYRIRHTIRSTDIAGQLENGRLYVILPQAGLDNLPQIEKRFHASRLTCTFVS